MAKENTIIKMEVITKVIGGIIKWMGMENYIMKVGKLYTKESLCRTISMESAKCTMTILLSLRVSSIILTSMALMTFGNFTKDPCYKMQNKVEEKYG